MRALVYGTGATGARVARHLASNADPTTLKLIERRNDVLDEVVSSLGPPSQAVYIDALLLESRVERFAEACKEIDVVVLTARDDHVDLALTALEAGAHVVSVSDDLETVQHLRSLDAVAKDKNKNLVIGAGFSPGLTCILSKHGARQFDDVDEIHIAKFGTGGPACARQHHKALRSEALDWHNSDWERRRGSSGRELCWFPDPVGGLDCYRGELPEPTLLLPAFSEAVRLSARVAGNRRDRATKWLPMLRRPHPEGLIGAVRVELRGASKGVRKVSVLGALDRPAVAAGHVAGLAARWAVEGRFTRSGAAGLASIVDDTVDFMSELSRCGVKAAAFEGALADR